MKILLNDNELIDKICVYNKYKRPSEYPTYSLISTEDTIKIINVTIWEAEFNTVEIAVSCIKNFDGDCSLSNHKVFIPC